MTNYFLIGFWSSLISKFLIEGKFHLKIIASVLNAVINETLIITANKSGMIFKSKMYKITPQKAGKA